MTAEHFIVGFDKALRTLFAKAQSQREMPGQNCPDFFLTAEDKKLSGALMRINHVGEVCAQALYQGQALTCGSAGIRDVLAHAAEEETEHLAWTEHRIDELGGRKSLLNPLWYVGALSMGILAGKAGDAWSLGFLAETERQVEAHLAAHLNQLPAHDVKSRAIVEQMRLDEMAHADSAINLGARALPPSVKILMKLTSRLMTRTAHYI